MWKKITAVAGLFSLFVLGCGPEKKTMDDQLQTKPEPVVEKPVTPPPPPEPKVDSAAIKEEQFKREADAVFKTIYFTYDSYALNEDARNTLVELGQFMKKYPEVTTKIEGYCDERGTSEYNIALGEKRANEAKKYLVSFGIASNKITTVSWGEEKPAETGNNEEAWAKNRRDEFSYER